MTKKSSKKKWKEYLSRPSPLYCNCEEHSTRDPFAGESFHVDYSIYDYNQENPHFYEIEYRYCLKCRKYYQHYNPNLIYPIAQA